MKFTISLSLGILICGNAYATTVGGSAPPSGVKPNATGKVVYGVSTQGRLRSIRPGVRIQMRAPVTGMQSPATASTEVSVPQPVDDMVLLSQTKLNGGVAQIAAGIIQISEAAHKKFESPGEEQVGQQLAEGLNVLASGNQDVSTARQIESHANEILSRESQIANAASLVPELTIELSEESMDPETEKLLKKMETVAKVDAEKLVEAVNDGDSVYNLAAGASGLKMTGPELEKAAQMTMDKMGKPTDPKLSEDLTLSALTKDLELFFKKSSAEPGHEKQAVAPLTALAGASLPKVADAAPKATTPAPNSEAERLQREFYREKSVFEMVSRQLKRRQHEFPRAPL